MKKVIFYLLTLVAVAFITLNFSQGQTATSVAQTKSLEEAIINVAQTTGPAVVSISTEYTPPQPRVRRFYFKGEGPFEEDDPFRRFFEDFFGELPIPEYRSKRIGLGSGTIINSEGYILTNEHVVGEADKITVKLSDGREFKAEVKGKDPRSDLAVIKINAKNLPVAELGDSDDLKIGQWVVAVGNPFGFALDNPEPTVTTGVISALHRSLGRVFQRIRDYSDLIQTDAAINPGNSGGPLVNLKGQVIGINVAIFTTSGGYEGVGFAIPINNAKRIIAKLIEGKKIVYGWLGVSVQDLDENLAKYFKLPDKNGVLVAKVLEKSPAQKAGIKEGDVIRKFDGKSINNVKELLSIVGSTEPGKRVKVIVLRDQRELTVDIEVGERPEDIEEIEERPLKQENWRGIKVKEYKQGPGVVITYIEPNSPADNAGLIPTDVILEINRLPIKDMADYNRVVSTVKGDALIRTKRGFVVLKGE